MGLETGEWRRCRSLSLTPPASLRSHGSRPRPTRHMDILFKIIYYIFSNNRYIIRYKYNYIYTLFLLRFNSEFKKKTYILVKLD